MTYKKLEGKVAIITGASRGKTKLTNMPEFTPKYAHVGSCLKQEQCSAEAIAKNSTLISDFSDGFYPDAINN